MTWKGQPVHLPGQWCLVLQVEEMMPGALRSLGSYKLLYAQAETTGLQEGVKELNWEKMAHLLRCSS